jgi:DNA-binding CsgD family transcriptional regulator
MTWRQMSLELGIAPGTVRGHLLRARERLGAVNTTNAVVRAIANRQISLEAITETQEDDDGRAGT